MTTKESLYITLQLKYKEPRTKKENRDARNKCQLTDIVKPITLTADLLAKNPRNHENMDRLISNPETKQMSTKITICRKVIL